MSCGRHVTRRQAHTRRRAKTSHTTRKAAHTAARRSVTAPARKAASARAAHKQVRRIGKTRPRWAKTARPKKRASRSKTAALKARSTASKHASRTARAHAQAVARAKDRAKARAAAGRPGQKTARQHAKMTRLYCRVATRGTVIVKQPVPPGAKWSLRASKSAVRGLKMYRAHKGTGPQKFARATRAARASRAGKG